MKKMLALSVASLAMVAGSVAIVASPAQAAANLTFSPTTDLLPGTSLTNIVVSVSSGYLCEAYGSETSGGANVIFGVDFYESVDAIYDDSVDNWIGYATDNVFQTYTQGQTSSAPITAEMPVLETHDPNKNIIAVGYCFDSQVEYGVDHGDGFVVTYSDLTFPSAATEGGTGTAHIIDGTSTNEFCDGGSGSTAPYGVVLNFWKTVDDYYNAPSAFVTIPAGWAGTGAGIGSFTAADFAAGEDVTFDVPADLVAGNYVVEAVCTQNSDGWAPGTNMGLTSVTVSSAALPATGVDSASVGGIATGAAALVALGSIAFAVRRRAVKA